MYGMIHQAARQLATEKLGDDGWNRILDKSGMSTEHFISAQSYGDDVTNRLIAAIGEVAGIATGDLLEAFGRHWVVYAKSSTHAAMMNRAGADLVSFLGGLDRMHASIKTVMPDASMPSFTLVEADADQIVVIYRSERPGLEAFVHGILSGLLEHFGEKGEITSQPEQGAVTFRIARRHA